MGLVDEVKKASQQQATGPRCGVVLLLVRLDAEDKKLAAELREVLTLPKEVARHSDIEKAMDARGYRLPQTSIRRHRCRECRCP